MTVTAVPLPDSPDRLAVVAHAWSQVLTEGRPQTVAVVGPANSGKSRLVAQACAEVAATAGTTLVGRPKTVPAPYDWLATALDAAAVTTLPIRDSAAAWLRQTRPAPASRLEPTALRRAAMQAVSSLVAGTPSVLVVENLHDLDPASLALVQDLASSSLPVLLLAVSRTPDSSDVPGPAARLIKRLCAAPSGRLLTVEPAAEAVDAHAGDQAAWARYAKACGRTRDCAVAALRGAATLLEAGLVGQARQLIAECVPPGLPGEDQAEQVLRRTLDAHTAPEKPHTRSEQSALEELTARESEVLACLADGMSNRQIAKSLGIAVRTVTVHVSNMLRKIGATSRTEAALLAVRHGMSSHRGQPKRSRLTRG